MPECGEGDWFAVPLREGSFAVGVVARANPKAALLGYFFGPRRSETPELEEVANLKPEDAVLVGTFGHLGLTQGKWPILGQLDGWDRWTWPMPAFVRYEELTGRYFHVFYDPTIRPNCSRKSRSSRQRPSRTQKTG